LIYLSFRIFFPYQGALWSLYIFQIGLYAIAAGMVPILAHRMGLGREFAFIAGWFVALLPTFSGFLSYTVTEGLIPALVIIFFFVHSWDSKRSLLYSGILLGVIILIRPAMIVLTLAYLPQARRFFSYRLGALSLSLIPVLIWQIWALNITGSWQGLHPIYHWDSNTLYRPVHQSVWDFHKMTGQTGVEFHRSISRLEQAARGEVPQELAINQLLSSLHPKVYETIPIETLRSAYADYVDLISVVDEYRQQGISVPGPLGGEQELIQKFEELKHDFVASNFAFANLWVPVDVYFRMGLHSNLSLYIFQKTLRGNPVIEVFRYISFFIHASVFLLFPFACLLYFRRYAYMILPIAAYLLYLAFIQRGVEERYTLPFLIPMFLLVLVWVKESVRLYQKLKLKGNGIHRESPS
jgi:hypothetical protein